LPVALHARNSGAESGRELFKGPLHVKIYVLGDLVTSFML